MKIRLIVYLFLLACIPLYAQPGNAGGSKGISGNEGVYATFDVKVFPNPVQNGRFTIELNNENLQEIRISNIAGVVVYQKKFSVPVSRFQVMTGSLPDGIYLLKVSATHESAKTLKLLVHNGL